MIEKDYRTVSIRINTELFKELKHYTVETNITLQKYITNLIIKDLKKYKT